MVDSTKTSITLGWEKPVYDGGSKIKHYILEQMNTEEKEWVIINPQVQACEYVVSHLKPGTYYYFRVSAVNCKGKGEDTKMYQPVQAKDILGLYTHFSSHHKHLIMTPNYNASICVFLKDAILNKLLF